MSLTTPNIGLSNCVINNCSLFEVTINNLANVSIDLSDYGYTSAEVIITNITTGAVQTFDVLPIISAGFIIAANSFKTIINATITDYEDGEYDIEIRLIAANTDYNILTKIKIFSYCAVRCCVDKMWAKYQGALGCGCKCNGEAYKNVMEAESLYMALQHASSCMNTEAVLEILKKLQRICSLEKCKCK